MQLIIVTDFMWTEMEETDGLLGNAKFVPGGTQSRDVPLFLVVLLAPNFQVYGIAIHAFFGLIHVGDIQELVFDQILCYPKGMVVF
jgi:hypothetical protein